MKKTFKYYKKLFVLICTYTFAFYRTKTLYTYFNDITYLTEQG